MKFKYETLDMKVNDITRKGSISTGLKSQSRVYRRNKSTEIQNYDSTGSTPL